MFALCIASALPYITTFTLYPKKVIPLDYGDNEETRPLIQDDNEDITHYSASKRLSTDALSAAYLGEEEKLRTQLTSSEKLRYDECEIANGKLEDARREADGSIPKVAIPTEIASPKSTNTKKEKTKLNKDRMRFDATTSLVRSHISSIPFEKDDNEGTLPLKYYLLRSTFLFHLPWFILLSLRWRFFLGNLNPLLYSLTTDTDIGKSVMFGTWHLISCT